jgi:broad specificity phosphatase PhoE
MPFSNPITIPPTALKLVTTTIFLIRHADITVSNNPDPSLNAAGQARAQELVHVLGQETLAAIYASEFRRTRETVHPLAQHLGVTVGVINSADVNALVQDIRSHHIGKRVLVAGHSNTIPQIISSFGGGQIPNIQPTEFDRLFVVTTTRLNRAKLHMGQVGVIIPERNMATLLRLQYGATSP